MKPQPAEEALNNYYEMLASQGEAKAALIETDPSHSEETTSLFSVARLLWETMVPVKPSEEFRQGLQAGLVAEAERRRVQRALGIELERKASRPSWIVPVAALGTASLVGVYAFWRFTRSPAPEEQALAA